MCYSAVFIGACNKKIKYCIGGEVGMTDRELLLERLERLAIVLDELMPQCAELVRDAIAMLKNQEAVEPKIIRMNAFGYPVHACGKCGLLITEPMNYCTRCGKPVKWE